MLAYSASKVSLPLVEDTLPRDPTPELSDTRRARAAAAAPASDGPGGAGAAPFVRFLCCDGKGVCKGSLLRPDFDLAMGPVGTSAAPLLTGAEPEAT